jgi:hypothetical protein
MSNPRDRSGWRPPGNIPGAEGANYRLDPPSELARAAGQRDARQELRAKYQSSLELVWKEKDECPVCKSQAWNVGDLVDVALRETSQTATTVDTFARGLLNQPPQVYVYVPVTCLYCGYTIFFHSGVLDVRLNEEVKTKPPLYLRNEEPR